MWIDDVLKLLAADALLLELEQELGIEEKIDFE